MKLLIGRSLVIVVGMFAMKYFEAPVHFCAAFGIIWAWLVFPAEPVK